MRELIQAIVDWIVDRLPAILIFLLMLYVVLFESTCFTCEPCTQPPAQEQVPQVEEK